MPGGHKKIDGNVDGISTRFSSTNQPTIRGRRKGIVREVREMLAGDGQITIPASSIIDYVPGKDGYVSVRITSAEAVSLQLLRWAASDDFRASLPAIKMLIENTDGRPIQRKNVDDDYDDQIPMGEYTDAEVIEELGRLQKVLKIDGVISDSTGEGGDSQGEEPTA